MVNSTLLPSSATSTLFLQTNLTRTLTRVYYSNQKSLIAKKRNSKTLITHPSINQTTRIAALSEEKAVVSIDSASDIVRNFYSGINNHDLGSVEDLIAEKCVYEDLVFPQPFVGRKAILKFFKKFTDSISKDLQFVIDDISNEDSLAVGATWHLEWKGRPFPFSKGCSFYRLEVVNGKKQIIYGRDSVEPSIKPGETALVAIKGVTWLLQRFPQLADRL
ncbi:Nuclear transport factor 2 (NTF2) family protein [Thalictrum thalictroides]|uniref:Nuclear transport factor 2 (NTF2) family protein n=1 Tax=Thalictrum thalictroides TaxID=46969 RepID=A0A7J6VBP4_THATH|nr:Nuclear transport factor 2 (NTF2) family protein [Thalictrum thalictroides]